MNSFQVELDPSSYPKLSSRSDNYTEWKAAWSIALKYAGVWSITSGESPRPIAKGVAQNEWDKQDIKAMVLLISSVHSDLRSRVASYGTSPKAWKYLSERFDRDSGNTLIYHFRALINIQYKDGEDLLAYIDNFHEMWFRITKRSQSSQQSVAKAMRQMFESDDVKGLFFLITLPDHITNHFVTRELTTFTEIHLKMLDIFEKHSIDTVDTSAYSRKPQSKDSNQGKSYDKRQSSPSNQTKHQNDECTWCRKHNMTFIGHLYTNCRKLKAHKEQRKASRSANPIPPKNRKSKGNQ